MVQVETPDADDEHSERNSGVMCSAFRARTEELELLGIMQVLSRLPAVDDDDHHQLFRRYRCRLRPSA